MLHLVKLCVGIESVEHFQKQLDIRLKSYKQKVHGTETIQHVTRMTPKRQNELLDGGSLYWIIKGNIACRQKIVALNEHVGEDQIKRCAIILALPLILTESQPKRPFQGWRYLKAEDAPKDLLSGIQDDKSDANIARELKKLGLI